MKAYVIVDIQILDQAKFQTYRQLAAASIEQYGGRYVVRGGRMQPLEGDWKPERLTMIEFESFEKANAWYNSPEYAPAKQIRQEALRVKILIVEGLS
jgi:uncharacterized protein (DUF1330 family)